MKLPRYSWLSLAAKAEMEAETVKSYRRKQTLREIARALRAVARVAAAQKSRRAR